MKYTYTAIPDSHIPEASLAILAFICRSAHQPVAMDQGRPPPLEDVLKTMRERVAKFNVEKIRPQDLAGAAGPPDEEP